MDWIDINAVKPNKCVDVLVAIDRKGLHADPAVPEVHVGHRMNNGDTWIIGSNFGFDMGTVTHWMPLPKHPSGG
jgi:hypothetical protein